MKHRHKVQIVGRKIDLLHTDVAATFARVKREQAETKRERENKVTPIKRSAGGRK